MNIILSQRNIKVKCHTRPLSLYMSSLNLHLPSVTNVEGGTIEVSKNEVTAGENIVERRLLCVEVIGVSILVSMDDKVNN